MSVALTFRRLYAPCLVLACLLAPACAGPSVDSPSASCRTSPAYCPDALLVDDAVEAELVPRALTPPVPASPAASTIPGVVTKVVPVLPLVLPARDSLFGPNNELMAAESEPKGIAGEDLPGEGIGWTKLRGNQGWRDRDGNIWKKDQLHKDHWDVSNPKGEKIREVDFDGNQIWPDGPKNKNKRP
jgi:hypothetical protein